MADLTYNWHSEKAIDTFTKLDGTIRFYVFVKAIMMKLCARRVLDFGAGRAAFWHQDTSAFKLDLRDLRTTGAEVTAADIDEAVLDHPCSDKQVVLRPGAPLPFADGEFDVVVSDMTFEHIVNVGQVCAELLRVLKPGGYICARTPNRSGYVRIASSLVPDALHARALRWVQPDREGMDVFPTVYRLNSPGQARRAFRGCSVFHFYDSAEPAYFFGSSFLYGFFLLLHRLLPPALATTICLFIRKDERAAA